MNIYFNLGLFFALLATAWYLYTLGAVIFELTAAYIKDRPAVKSPYLRFMIKAKASLYGNTVRRYRIAGYEAADDALTGEHLAGTAALGLLYSTATLFLWPVTLIILTLKSLRKYNTDEVFRVRIGALLKREKKEVHYDL